ncbi:MAG TPA: 50S ribosomal protein L25 [Patescibacteria group bacterium]|nr:50S ribosomal protein L25 [Patescibacteria group bacterium]
MSDKYELSVVVRGENERPNVIRNQGRIPAVVYGPNTKNEHVTVNSGEFEKLLRKAGENSVVELKDNNGKTHPVLIHDVQKHYLTGKPIHVDFYVVDLSKKVTTHVPLEFIGTSLAVKSLGGTLVKLKNDVTIESLPMNIPHTLEVDLSKLSTFDDHITASDLSIPAGAVLITDPSEILAKVQPPRDVEAELATPVVEDVSKVEVIKPEKEAEAAEAETK